MVWCDLVLLTGCWPRLFSRVDGFWFWVFGCFGLDFGGLMLSDLL